MSPDLTPRSVQSLRLFLDYAGDAGNWNGSPLVSGNVGRTVEDKGNLTDLKKLGLVYTQAEGRDVWLSFTPAGVALAAQYGIDLSWV